MFCLEVHSKYEWRESLTIAIQKRTELHLMNRTRSTDENTQIQTYVVDYLHNSIIGVLLLLKFQFLNIVYIINTRTTPLIYSTMKSLD